jgi:hypothetical protein
MSLASGWYGFRFVDALPNNLDISSWSSIFLCGGGLEICGGLLSSNPDDARSGRGSFRRLKWPEPNAGVLTGGLESILTV